MELAVATVGSGDRVVMLHGGVAASGRTWFAQQPLAERWALEMVDRPGYGDSCAGADDFLVEPQLVVDQVLTEPAHLVGFSYGAIIAMLAAAMRPEYVKTLTLIEPPTPQAAGQSDAIRAWTAEIDEFFANLPEDPADVATAFFALFGVPFPVDDPLPDWLDQGARTVRNARPPTQAKLPLSELRGSGIPIMVMSGGHDDRFEALCDGVAEATGAERAVLSGMSHCVPLVGEPFNTLVEAFWRSAEAEPHSRAATSSAACGSPNRSRKPTVPR